MKKRERVHKLSTVSGIAIVVANMIGTGAFTSLGFQLASLHNTYAILTLWILGGVLALAGAFSYAEVGSIIRKSGGEYVFLSRIYHPIVGYLSGWVSLTVGFAAPIALSSMAFVEYFPVRGLNVKLFSVVVVGAVTIIHTLNLKTSATFQNLSTLLKVLLIIALVCIGLVLPPSVDNALVSGQGYFNEIGTMAFAVGLVYVSYSYCGWNAAAYITEEFKNPLKSLPAALIGGTILVTVLYTLLQFVFLRHASIDELSGQLNVGVIVVEEMLGGTISKWFGLGISLLLISGISAMIWVGTRVTVGMAGEHRLWYFFRSSSDGIAKRALGLQFAISSILIISGTFQQILIYCGILLTVSSVLVVFGVFILRNRQIEQKQFTYRSPLFPFFQIIFLGISAWMIVYIFYSYPFETLAGLSNLLVGYGTYFFSRRLERADLASPT